MAFDPTNNNFTYRLLVEIALHASYTLRLSTDYLVLDDGTAYDGLLLGMSPFRRTAGDILDPRLQLPSLRLTLDNKRDAITGERLQDLIEAYEWGNKDVTLKLGQGSAAANYETIFVGKVFFPGGISFTDSALTVRVNDVRAADARLLPPNVFNKTTYPNMEAKSVGQRIPLVYGDWQTTAGNGEQIPAYQIDSTAGTGGKFKIADHALKSIQAVYLNGSAITGNCSLDAANGEFTITTGTYTPATDVVTVNVQGATDDGTTSGTMIEAMADVLDDLLQTWLSVASGSIDSTALTAWDNQLTANDVVRRVISTAEDSTVILASLLSEGFADLTISGGKYTVKYRIVSPSSSLDTYRAEDIITGSDGTKAFEVIRDPERIYTNFVDSLYGYDPANERYTGAYNTSDSGAITAVATRQQRSMEFKWLYEPDGVEARVDLELYTFGNEPESIEVELSPVGATKEPTNQFRLIYNKYGDTAAGGAVFQVRSVSLHPTTFQPVILAWSQIRLTPHVWTNGSGPDWDSATTAQQALNGFWTNDSGEADPVYYWADTGANDWASASVNEQAEQSFWTDDAGEADPGDSGSAGSVWRAEPTQDPDSFWI